MPFSENGLQIRWLARAAGLLALIATSPAFADVDCNQSVVLLQRFAQALPNDEQKEQQSISLDVDRLKDSLSLECLCLGQKRLITGVNPKEPAQWDLFCSQLGSVSRDDNILYNACMASTCRNQETFRTQVLTPVCLELGKPKNECQGVVVGKKPLPKWRLGTGIALLIVGVPLTVLGAVHMGVPVFKTDSGCSAFAFDSPCTAPPYAVGAPIFSLGILATLGGALSLALPNR